MVLKRSGVSIACESDASMQKLRTCLCISGIQGEQSHSPFHAAPHVPALWTISLECKRGSARWLMDALGPTWLWG